MENPAIETIEYKGLKIQIYSDLNSDNPITEWDGWLGQFCCWHSRYSLGNCTDFAEPSEAEAYAKKNNALLYPLYMYDHSGIALSLSPFSCRWDSGQLGYIMVKREAILERYSVKRITKEIKDKVLEAVQSEVATYNQYLSGDVYGYVVEKEGEQIDSCWGFYGMEHVTEEGKEIVDCHIKYTIKKHCEQVKAWIQNRVPLINRTALV